MARIFHIINSLDVGGAEVSLLKLINNDSPSNEHFIISLKKGKELLKHNKKNLKNVYKILDFKYLNLIFNFIHLIFLLRRTKPNVIQCWMYHSCCIGGLAAKIAGNKKIIWSIRHNDPKGAFLSNSSRMAIILCKIFSFFIPNYILFNSTKSFNSHKKYGFFFNHNNKVIFNGYVNKFKTNPKKKIYNDNHFIIATLTRWDKQKNFFFLLDCLKEFNEENNQIKWTAFLGGSNVHKENSLLIKKINEFNLTDKINLLGFQKMCRILLIM